MLIKLQYFIDFWKAILPIFSPFYGGQASVSRKLILKSHASILSDPCLQKSLSENV